VAPIRVIHPVAPVGLGRAQLDNEHSRYRRAELGGKEGKELDDNIVLRLTASEWPLGVEGVEKENGVAERVRVDPDVIEGESNSRGVKLLDGKIVGLSEAVVTETLESLVAIESHAGRALDHLLQVGVRDKREDVGVDERVALGVVSQHELVLPPVSGVGVLVVDRADEALGIGLGYFGVVVLAVHGGGKVSLGGRASIL
jgi:hypothetical protein